MQLLPGGGREDVCVHWGLRAPLSSSSGSSVERRAWEGGKKNPAHERHYLCRRHRGGGGATVTAWSPDSCIPRIASAEAMSDRPARPGRGVRARGSWSVVI